MFNTTVELFKIFSNQSFNYYKSVAQHEWLVISLWKEKHIVKLISKEMKRFSDMSLMLIKSPGAQEQADVIFQNGHRSSIEGNFI